MATRHNTIRNVLIELCAPRTRRSQSHWSITFQIYNGHTDSQKVISIFTKKYQENLQYRLVMLSQESGTQKYPIHIHSKELMIDCYSDVEISQEF
jgi:hypothetical protein